MRHASIAVPVEHQPMVHEIQMGPAPEPQSVTLLELIEAVNDVSESEQEVLATVMYMLSSGRVQLSGNFRDTPVEKLCG